MPISDSSRNLTTTDECWPCSPTYQRDGSALAIDASGTARPQTCTSAASSASARCRTRIGAPRGYVCDSVPDVAPLDSETGACSTSSDSCRRR